MKKLFSKLMLVAMAAMTFTACEDVPEPYGKPYEKGNNTEIEGAKGTGTKDDPFNCIAALNYGNGLASGETSGDYYYIKGKVVSVKEEFTTNFGNGTFYISEDGTSTNQFYVYRVLYLGNKKFADGDKQIAVGDDVVICAKITNYNGTIETQQKEGFVYELNGESRGGEPSGGGEPAGDPTGEGTEASPYNVAAALQFTKALGSDVESDKDIYIKGKISQISSEYAADNFGNATFYISDDGKTSNEFYCYRTLYLGNTKYTAGKTQIQVGDDVIINDDPGLSQLIAVAEREKRSVIGIVKVSSELVSRYGIVNGIERDDGIFEVKSLVEKPSPEEAPSNMAIIGRYVLMPEIFDCLRSQKPGKGGEIQLTDALDTLCKDQGMLAVPMQGVRFDAGNWIDYLAANIYFGIQDESIRPGLLQKLDEILTD